MASQRRPYRAPRGGAAFREWHEILVLAAILGVAVLLMSTLALYSISERRITGERSCTQYSALSVLPFAFPCSPVQRRHRMHTSCHSMTVYHM